MKVKKITLPLSLFVLFCMSAAFAQTSYNFKTVDYPGDSFTQLLGINNSGDIAGYHGFAINAGFTYNLGSGQFTIENFPKAEMTQVIGINNEPFKTSGFYVLKNGKTEGFTDYKGTFVTVNYPKTPFNQLLSQNDFGQSAGYYSTKKDGSGPDHAYVYDEFGGAFELFTIPGSASAQATGINNAGDVCGFTIDDSPAGATHGWLKVQGHFTLLDAPSAAGFTQALGMNNNGQIVGTYTDSAGLSHGFVYTVSSSTWQTIDEPNGVGSTLVNGINDKGVLVGFYGTSPTNDGFVATPQ